jgi:hypothetical protein
MPLRLYIISCFLTYDRFCVRLFRHFFFFIVLLTLITWTCSGPILTVTGIEDLAEEILVTGNIVTLVSHSRSTKMNRIKTLIILLFLFFFFFYDSSMQMEKKKKKCVFIYLIVLLVSIRMERYIRISHLIHYKCRLFLPIYWRC